MKLFATSLILGLFCLSPATAEQRQGQHRVFWLDQVNDLSIGSVDNSVVVTLAGRVFQFTTFPLCVSADLKLDSASRIEGINANVNGDQTLVVLGKKTVDGKSEGTMLIYRDIDRSLNMPIEPLSISLGISPFSQALLKGGDEIFAVNPVWNSVIHASISALVAFADDVPGSTFKLNDLSLKCGLQFSFRSQRCRALRDLGDGLKTDRTWPADVEPQTRGQCGLL